MGLNTLGSRGRGLGPYSRGRKFAATDAGGYAANGCRKVILILLLAGRSVTSRSEPSADGPGAFATGKYRNLFAEAGHSRKEVKQRIEAAFQQLFHGDPGSPAVYYAAWAKSNRPGA